MGLMVPPAFSEDISVRTGKFVLEWRHANVVTCGRRVLCPHSL